MPTPEERALSYANRVEDTRGGVNSSNSHTTDSDDGAMRSSLSSLRADDYSRDTSSSMPGTTTQVEDSIVEDGHYGLSQSGDSSSSNNSSSAYDGTTNDSLAEMRAEELLSADRASYGQLRFRPLDARRRYLSILLLTLQPYVQNCLRQWYQHEMDEAADAVAYRAAYALRHPRRAALRRLGARYLYPVLHILSHALELIFQALYLLEMTPYHSFLYRLCGIARRRATMKDQLLAMHPRVQRATMYARVLLLLILFGFRLLDFSRNSTANGGAVLGEAELPIPSAPVWGEDVTVHGSLPSSSQGGAATGSSSIRSSSSSLAGAAAKMGDGARGVAKGAVELAKPEAGMCPVCQKPVTNVAVCTASGMVGCYPCLQVFIREHGFCPVTGKSAGFDQIRRVYET